MPTYTGSSMVGVCSTAVVTMATAICGEQRDHGEREQPPPVPPQAVESARRLPGGRRRSRVSHSGRSGVLGSGGFEDRGLILRHRPCIPESDVMALLSPIHFRDRDPTGVYRIALRGPRLLAGLKPAGGGTEQVRRSFPGWNT